MMGPQDTEGKPQAPRAMTERWLAKQTDQTLEYFQTVYSPDSTSRGMMICRELRNRRERREAQERGT